MIEIEDWNLTKDKEILIPIILIKFQSFNLQFQSSMRILVQNEIQDSTVWIPAYVLIQ